MLCHDKFWGFEYRTESSVTYMGNGFATIANRMVSFIAFGL